MRSLKTFIYNPRLILSSCLNRFGQWLPDKTFLELKYWCEMGKKLNLKAPKTFQEKIQWLKLYNRKHEYTQMVDKYAVKEYVAKIIGEQYIIPTLGVWESFDEIDFDSLPNKFVLKTTHGGGSCGVVVCTDKSTFDFEKAKSKLSKSLATDIYGPFREWPYKDVPRRIIAEQFIELPGKKDLTDYKFFCFNGEPKYIQVIQDRNTKETIDFFDNEWNHQEFYGLNPIQRLANHTIPKPANYPIPKPKNFSEMLNIARELSKNQKFIRVDLYQTENVTYFGELTFYPASGIGTFTPEQWNKTLGDLIKLYA